MCVHANNPRTCVVQSLVYVSIIKHQAKIITPKNAHKKKRKAFNGFPMNRGRFYMKEVTLGGFRMGGGRGSQKRTVGAETNQSHGCRRISPTGRYDSSSSRSTCSL